MDAEGQVLGHFASEVATKLIGKNKKTYTPHVDGGDYVVVINVSKIVVTGNKGEDKKYYTHTGRPGSLKTRTFDELQAKYPGRAVELAVKNMLPKNKHQSERMARLKIYADSEHKHQSQLASK